MDAFSRLEESAECKAHLAGRNHHPQTRDIGIDNASHKAQTRELSSRICSGGGHSEPFPDNTVVVMP